MEVTVIQRLLVAFLFLISAASANAAYNDVWYDIAEPGWGVFVEQSNTFQFLAFFIYGPTAGPPTAGPPTWYTATLLDDGTGNYSGGLYATTGTYFANP